MSSIPKKTCTVLAIALLASGCATGPDGKPMGPGAALKTTFASDDPCSNNARNVGIALGGVLGAIVGNQIGGKNHDAALAGAGVGALLGGLIGADMDRRRCEISKVAKVHNLDIVMSDITLGSGTAAAASADGTTAAASAGTAANGTAATKKPSVAGMSLTIIDRGQQFATGSAKPSDASFKAFGDVADQYRVQAADKQDESVKAALVRTRQMRILLIGHTDDTGSSAQNADLSEGRARAVAEIFAKHGFTSDQIFYQGAGEVFPIASNNTEEGRARNRRVEIVDLSDDSAFTAFLESRRPNTALYRPATEASAKTAVASSTPAAPAKAAEMKKPVAANAPDKAGKTAVASATPAAPAAAAPVTAAKPLPVQALANLDLGGKPANGQFRSADIGKTEHTGGFSIISAAYASDETPMGSCATDRPRVSRGVKSLSDGKVYKTSEYLPGTAATSWGGKVNGHLVGMRNVSVLRDGGQPASQPDFFIWKNHVEGAGAPPDLSTRPAVNAYLGDKALLYRVFLSEGPVRCLDMVIPKGAAATAPNSNIVYEHNSALYQTDFSPAIIR